MNELSGVRGQGGAKTNADDEDEACVRCSKVRIVMQFEKYQGILPIGSIAYIVYPGMYIIHIGIHNTIPTPTTYSYIAGEGIA